jgi:MFS transporter
MGMRDGHRVDGTLGARGLPVRLLLILGALSAIGPASMDVYLPGLPAVADAFGTSASSAQLTVAAFLVGLGAGQLVAGSLSDVLGRRRPMLAAIVLYVAATCACAVAPTLPLLVLARLLQARPPPRASSSRARSSATSMRGPSPPATCRGSCSSTGSRR